ncbi:Biotin-protein ligase N-terminal domain-containing protein [Desulfarculales bacterium]
MGEPVRGATLTGSGGGPQVLMHINRVASDLGFGLGTCSKKGQDSPVTDAQPILRIPNMVVGGPVPGLDYMPAGPQPARLLWDQGGLWSLFTLRACREQGLAITPISAAQVSAGGLAGAGLLVVPGGWPSRKLKALGVSGAQAVRDFVQAGGRYLGFCGGAGLALSVPDGLGLVSLGRAEGPQRLPGLSGPLWVAPGPAGEGHPLWRGLDQPSLLNVWWPAQFAEPTAPELKVLAVYGPPGPDLCTADMRMNEVDAARWPDHEAAYGQRLGPFSLEGRPAMIQARAGRGLLLLSYPHLDTPGDIPGGRALANLWRAWLDSEPSPGPAAPEQGRKAPALAGRLARQAQDLWQLGLDLGLWRPRHPEMPLWRRGVRGLEFWELCCLCQAVAQATGPGETELILLRELAAALEPIWRQAPEVLEAQAARLGGWQPPESGACLERAWFPAPRRLDGPLARVLLLLEQALLQLESYRSPGSACSGESG